ncbi:hypothetical protein DNTS_002052 [Danionella cerebrum]|uniref:Vesicle transport protein n=1 Tax=Danionella cerebrum TaxID=2873325 RepID=A0A553MZ43_9TELE|nr:hypothetical protein DNTS_002052 [Danionella translucida]
MDKLRAVLGGQDGNNDNRNILQAANEASTLGWGTRVKGFVGCMVVGIIFSILGVCCIFIPKIGIILFIVFYTLGNICSLVSTMFLMGPVKQLKRIHVWFLHSVQHFGYGLSYIPFARDAVLKFFSMLFSKCKK